MHLLSCLRESLIRPGILEAKEVSDSTEETEQLLDSLLEQLGQSPSQTGGGHLTASEATHLSARADTR